MFERLMIFIGLQPRMQARCEQPMEDDSINVNSSEFQSRLKVHEARSHFETWLCDGNPHICHLKRN